MKKRLLVFSFLSCVVLGSCGYTTRSTLSSDIKTIHIESFENKISYTSESANRDLYIPLLEVDIRDEIIDRFLFDGNLKVREKDAADLILKGQLLQYDRRPLRYTDNDDVEEYRIYLRVSLTLIDSQSEEVLWQEPNFVGESTYFITGPSAKSEDVAIDEAILDLARRVVERTVEAW